MSQSLKHLNDFRRILTDINISHNPLSRPCVVILNEVERDHYQDAVISEGDRAFKWCLVSKNQDMSYVIEEFDELLEDDETLPWIITLTDTDLPRLVQAEDQILVDGIKYTVSRVKPVNRDTPSVLLCMVYPERSATDELKVYTASVSEGVLSIVWGGNPKSVGLCDESIRSEDLRVSFTPFLKVPEDLQHFYLFDDENYVRYDL